MPQDQPGPAVAGAQPETKPDPEPVTQPESRPGGGDPQDAALRSWQEHLLRTGPADSLLVAESAPAGWLDLTHAHPSGTAQLLAGRPTRLSSLVRDPMARSAALAVARGLVVAADELAATRAIRASSLAVGLAGWPSPQLDGVIDLDAAQGPTSAPVLLRGCSMRPLGAAHDDYELHLDDVATVNPELVRRLAADHGIELDPEALGAIAFGRDGFDPRPVFSALEELCEQVEGFTLHRRLVVGTFVAGAGAMVADLAAAGPALRGHDLFGPVLTADGSGAGLSARPAERVTPASLPDPHPDEETLVIDLDPAQHRVLDAVLAGGHVAVEGPPGSGLTQTLTAAAVALAGQGRRVLLLAGGQPAADGVLARLQGAGLRDLALDLQDGSGDRGRLLASLAADLDRARAQVAEQAQGGSAPPVSDRVPEQLRDTLLAARQQLDAAGAALHTPRGVTSTSAYQAMVALSALVGRPEPPRTGVRLPPEVIARHAQTGPRGLAVALTEAAGTGAFTMTVRDTRWLDAKVSTDTQAQETMRAARAARDGLGPARAAMAAMAEQAGLVPARTPSGWAPELELLLGVRDTLDVLQPEVFEQSITDLIEVTGPDRTAAGRGVLARTALRRRAKAMVRPGVHLPDLHAALVTAQEQRARWQQMSPGGGWPRVPNGLAEADAVVRSVLEALSQLDAVLDPRAWRTPGLDAVRLADLPMEALETRLQDLVADEQGLAAQPARAVVLARLRHDGLGPLVDDLRARRVAADAVGPELELAWWSGVLQSLVAADPVLSGHQGVELRRASAVARLADSALLRDGSRRIRARLDERVRLAVAAHPDQARWLGAEVHRGHRSHWPVDLLRRAPDVLWALRPIWVLPADLVARALPRPAAEPMLDAVVVDEATHVSAPEAAATLARARQVVVGGDRRRQPVAGGVPSLLEAVVSQVAPHRLDRDHRARDGRRLAPLTRFYPEGWVLTPGTQVTPRLAVDVVAGGTVVAGAPEEELLSPKVELERVLFLIEAHARHRPEESLMVLTLTAQNAERIEQAVRAQVAHRPHLAAWLESQHPGTEIDEPFCVRPVERVAGLERDNVVIPLGLGLTAHGRVLHRFGPLERPDGEGLLITALSRARERTIVVTCVPPAELDPDRLRTPGAVLLGEVLATQGHGLLPDATAAEPDALVADLRERLAAHGIPVVAGGGDTAWPIDLGLGDPRVPGRMLVAVDLDGPRHAAHRSVRERERQRRQWLERAGWVYARVATMDLFQDPDAEVERLRRVHSEAMGEG